MIPMSERIEDTLKSMIVERLFMQVRPEDLDEAASLIDAYGVDSVSLLELVVGLEEQFGIVVGDEEFSVANFESVAKLAAFVRAKLPS